MGRPSTDKRERLVAAAIERFHRLGYTRTSLADVAKSAGISAGNVFYYFKTKDELARAVIDEWCRLLIGYLTALDPLPSPWRRVGAFIDQADLQRETYVTMGCPLASLTRDLRQENDDLKSEVARIFAVQFDWLAAQFRGAGVSNARASRHARTLMTSYHGAILLAYTQGDAGLITQETARLRKWLSNLRSSAAVNS